MLDALDVEDVTALAQTGSEIRALVLNAPLPPELDAQIKAAYDLLNPQDVGEKWPCVPQPPLKIYPKPLLQASKKPF